LSLETELRALAIDWPGTPELRLALGRRRRRRGPLAAALAAAAIAAVAAAFAVPQSRGAILRFLHLGGVSIRFVDTLPPAEARPLTDGLGPVIPLGSARRFLPGLLVPPLDRVPPLHYEQANVVSLVFEHDGAPVLLSEFPGGGGTSIKKLAAFGTDVERVAVGPGEGLWISGAQHVVTFPRRSLRLAGNVLLWEHGRTTYRLEGPKLGKDDAVALAESLRKG
jgi:hypothetical protein